MGLSPSQIGVVLAAAALAAVIAAPFWSHVRDRHAGTVRTLQVAFVSGRRPRDRARPHRIGPLGHRGRCCGIGGRASPSNTVDGRARGLDPRSSAERVRIVPALGQCWLGGRRHRLRRAVPARGVRADAAPVRRGGRRVRLVRRTVPHEATGSTTSDPGVRVRSEMPSPTWRGFPSTSSACSYLAPPRAPAGTSSPCGSRLEAKVRCWSGSLRAPVRSSRSRSCAPAAHCSTGSGLEGYSWPAPSVYAAASFAWAFVTSPLAVSAIRVGIGVGFGLTYVTLVVITGTLVPERLTNTGQTLQQICSQGLAPIVGGLVGGFVYEHIGARQLFLGSAAGIVAGIAIVWTSTATLAAPGGPSDLRPARRGGTEPHQT